MGFVLGCLYQNMLDDLIAIQTAQLQRIIETRGSQNISTTQICKSLQPWTKIVPTTTYSTSQSSHHLCMNVLGISGPSERSRNPM